MKLIHDWNKLVLMSHGPSSRYCQSHEPIPSENIMPSAARFPEGHKISWPLEGVHFLHLFRILPKQDHGGGRNVFLQPFGAFHLSPSGQRDPMFSAGCSLFPRISILVVGSQVIRRLVLAAADLPNRCTTVRGVTRRIDRFHQMESIVVWKDTEICRIQKLNCATIFSNLAHREKHARS